MKKQLFLIVFICSQILFGCNYDQGAGPGFPEQITYNSTFLNGNKIVDESYKGLFLIPIVTVNKKSEKEMSLALAKSYNDQPSFILLNPSIVIEQNRISRNNFKCDLKDKGGNYYKILWKYSKNGVELKFSGSLTNLNDEIGENYILFTYDF